MTAAAMLAGMALGVSVVAGQGANIEAVAVGPKIDTHPLRWTMHWFLV